MKIRNFQAEDLNAILSLFYETVHTVNRKDYTSEQCAAWATGKADAALWRRTLENHCSLVAEEQGQIIGFGDMDSGGYLDRLFVHKDHQREGVAAAICRRLEREVNAAVFTTCASITALGFFLKMGYCVLREQQIEREGVALVNYFMEKSNSHDSEA